MGHFDGIVPSLVCILTRQPDVRGAKYLLKTSGNTISETLLFKQNVARCLSPQELVPLGRVPKPPTIHYQPAI